MIFLNKIEIEKAITLDEVMNKIEEAYKVFYEEKFYMPPRPVVEYKNKTLLYMPCFMDNSLGTKIISVFPENANIGEPAIYGLMLLNDYTTGKPIALMDGQAITSIRTGAVGGVGVRHLSNKNASTVGIIGAGVQGFWQALYACKARPIKTIFLFNRNNKDLTVFIKNLKDKLVDESINIVVCDDVRSLIEKSEIVITATTTNDPVIPNDKDLLRGKCFIAVGSYKHDMREFSDAIFSLVDKVYVDLPFACEESGDLVSPIEKGILTEDRVVTMSALLNSKEDVTIKNENETQFFKSVGMGLFDLIIAKAIYENAKLKNIGQIINM